MKIKSSYNLSCNKLNWNKMKWKNFGSMWIATSDSFVLHNFKFKMQSTSLFASLARFVASKYDVLPKNISPNC